MNTEITIILDSISEAGKRIITLEIKQCEEVQVELLRHKSFNCSIYENNILITSTDWGSFLDRYHPKKDDGEGSFIWLSRPNPGSNISIDLQELAIHIRDALNSSPSILLQVGEYHLPYVSEEDYVEVERVTGKRMSINQAKNLSVSRSYLVCASPKDDVMQDINFSGILEMRKELEAFRHHATPMSEDLDIESLIDELPRVIGKKLLGYSMDHIPDGLELRISEDGVILYVNNLNGWV